jgi:ATP-dependent RNA helicase DeaD
MERQTLFFSATMPRPIRDLIEKHSREPQNVQIEQKAMTVPTVEQVYYEVDRRFKIELLTRLIDVHDLKLGIIFCNTKRMVDELVDHLEAQGYMADRLHGDMTQAMRDRVMNKFRKSGLEFLVATDIAARGIDVDDIQVVFNYDLPYDGEDYVHRIGRTGRAGREGRAISFVSGREVFQIRNIERYTNTRIHRGRIPTEADVEGARENLFLGKLRATLQSGEFKRNDHLIERLLEEGFSSTDVASACLAMLQGGSDGGGKPNTEDSERDERQQRGGGFRDGPRNQSDERRGPRFDERENGPGARRPEAPLRPAMTRPMAPAAPAAPTAPSPAVPPAAGKPAPSVAPAVSAPAKPPAATTTATPAATAPVTSGPAPAVAAVTKAVATQPPSKPAAIVTPAAPSAPTAPVTPAAPKPAPKPAPIKTYSDKEILASVSNPTPVRPKPGVAKAAPATADAPAVEADKPSRATPDDQTRLWMNLGEAMEVKPIDIVNAISGETGLPGKVVGSVDVRHRHLFVDVATEHSHAIIAKLNRAVIKGHKVKVKVA